jgi:hypothetical protein
MASVPIAKRPSSPACPPNSDSAATPLVITKHYAIAALGLLLAAAAPLSAVPTNPPAAPELEQVRQLIRTHLTGSTDAELDRYALDGLLHGLRGKVKLLDPHRNLVAAPHLDRHSVLEAGVAYLRVRTVALGLADEVATLYQALAATNQLKGLILDLRFAEGDDYLAATTVANLFVAEERDLLDWGRGLMKSTAKTNALAGPVAVLINNETAGAPEALAAVLRETGVGLLLGNATRGAAMTTKEFPLATGQRLRIASTPVKLPGDLTIPLSGVAPDIQVAVSVAEERSYLNDPYTILTAATNSPSSLTSTNRVTRRPRTNEADLVRARREGLNLADEPPSLRESEPEPILIRDPALARAVDLLKGLAVVRRPR